MKKTLWTKNFTLLTVATILGAAGGIAGNFALSFYVFEETGSTFASALLIAINIIPNFIIPLFASPIMDRLPRKPFLVGGDFINGILYALAGIYLLNFRFTYIGYLLFSLLLSCLSAFDYLAYQSIYPNMITEGFEEKGYTVSGMIYPVMQVVVAPVAAVLLKTIGVANILLIQGGLSIVAAVTESKIKITEINRMEDEKFSISLWWKDIKSAAGYLKKEKGLLNIFIYMAATNGIASGYSPLLVAFFSTVKGFTVAMYSFFSAAEFIGRSIGGIFHYNFEIPQKKKFSFAFFVYQTYELIDTILLWIPYPFMLLNRGICGFLGINSATLRQSAVQRYIPDEYRSRINAFDSMLSSVSGGVISLAVGAMGEVLNYRLCVSICGIFTSLVLWVTIWRRRNYIRRIYNARENAA